MSPVEPQDLLSNIEVRVSAGSHVFHSPVCNMNLIQTQIQMDAKRVRVSIWWFAIICHCSEYIDSYSYTCISWGVFLFRVWQGSLDVSFQHLMVPRSVRMWTVRGLSIFVVLSKLLCWLRCFKCPYIPIHKLVNVINNVCLTTFFLTTKRQANCDSFCSYRYFSESATEEMLDEWRPLFCPFDVTMQRAISYFELFLPTTLPPELHHKGFK